MRRMKSDSSISSKLPYSSNENQQHEKEMESITKIVQQKYIDRDRLTALKYYLSDQNNTIQQPSVVQLDSL